MKKLIAVLMAIAMIAALSVTAFAAANIEDVVLTNPSVNVSGKYNAGGDTDAYKVTLTWDAMEYDYYKAAVRTWDVDTMKWVTSQEAGWFLANGTSNEITVDNASSQAITATFTYNKETGYDAVTGSFTDDADQALTDNKLPVAAATAGDEENNGTVGTATAKFVIGGELADTAANMTLVGTITVALS